jgi:hypothetical protein
MPFSDVGFELQVQATLSFCLNTNSNYFSIFVAPIVWLSLVVLHPSPLIYWNFFAVPL